MVRALASHQLMWPGFKSRRPRHMWVEFAGGFSPGTPVFPSPEKPTFPNSNSTRNQVDEEPLCGCATSKSLFIYLFFNFQFPVPRFSNIHLWMPCVPRQPMWLVTIQSTLTKYFWLRFCAASYRWFIIRYGNCPPTPPLSFLSEMTSVSSPHPQSPCRPLGVRTKRWMPFKTTILHNDPGSFPCRHEKPFGII